MRQRAAIDLVHGHSKADLVQVALAGHPPPVLHMSVPQKQNWGKDRSTTEDDARHRKSGIRPSSAADCNANQTYETDSEPHDSRRPIEKPKEERITNPE